MQVTATIKKDKRNIYCGHVFFMENLLIEHGRSYVEVEEKLRAHLLGLFELSVDALQLKIKTHHVIKAAHVIRRMERKINNTDLQVSFNSKYFI